MVDKNQPELKYSIVDYKDTPKKLQKKHLFKTGGPEILTLRFDPEDTMIAAGCSDGNLRIFHLHSNNLKINVPVCKGGMKFAPPCTSIRWRPPQFSAKVKNVLITGGSDGDIVHWHVTTGKELSRINEPDNQIFGMDFNKDGTHFATVGKDHNVRVYDEETNAIAHHLGREVGHNNRVFCVKFIPEEPNLLITGGWDCNVIFWDIRENKSIRSFLGPKIAGDAIDYKNGQVITGANRARGQLELWDFKQAELIKSIDYEPGQKSENGAFVYATQFSKTSDESILVGSTGINAMRIFDMQRDFLPFGQVEGLEQGIYAVDYGNFSNKFACGGGDGAIFVMSLASQ